MIRRFPLGSPEPAQPQMFGLQMDDGEHRQAEDDAGGSTWGEGEGTALPAHVFGFEYAGG